MQADWKLDLLAVAGEVETLDMQSSRYWGETGSWAFLPTFSVLSQVVISAGSACVSM